MRTCDYFLQTKQVTDLYAVFPFKIGSFFEFHEKFENVKNVFILSHGVPYIPIISNFAIS